MYRTTLLVVSALLITHGFASAQVPSPVASYYFNNTLASQEGGSVPALIPTDPLGTNGFLTQTVFGQNQTVYAFNGTGSPVTNQAGLTLNTTGLVTPTNYSAELVFQFAGVGPGWSRILDVENRNSDNGFYVDPTHKLQLYPAGASGPTTYTYNTYHHIVLTVTSGTTVKAYLDGNLEFTVSSIIMNINNANNPGNLLNLFLDNTGGGGGFGDFSSGDIALFRMYDTVLSGSDVQTLYSTLASVPEPATIVLGSLAVVGFVGYRQIAKRRRPRRVVKG